MFSIPWGRLWDTTSVIKRERLGAALLALLLSGLVGTAGPAHATERSAASLVDAELCESLPFCTPSFWSWELALATYENRESDARVIAQQLMSLQKKNGRWGLGSPWGKTAVDFKQRTRHDAESWEVAEVGLNLLRHHQKFGDPAAKRAARNAASYLRQRVVSLGTGRYLAHMPDCNNYLQPHSTLASAALLDQFKRYREIASQLKDSGKKMKWRRIVPKVGRTDLQKWRWGPRINDYERIQSGWYLTELGDARGPRILNRFGPEREMDFRLAQPYAVMVDLFLGNGQQARARAEKTNLELSKGFDVALASWVQTGLR